MMGWTTMQRLAARTTCGRIHAPYKHSSTRKTQGFQAALRERDDPYGDSPAIPASDSVVKLNIVGCAQDVMSGRRKM